MELAASVRLQTLERLAELGFPEPPIHLPLLADGEDHFLLRPQEEVVERLLVLNARINISFGMPPRTALAWLTEQGLAHCLTETESALVRAGPAVDPQEQAQVESLWALAWALSLTSSLDPLSYCGDDLVTLVPDLRVAETRDDWLSRQTPRLRPAHEVLAELDLLYAMTWGLVDARLAGTPRPGEVEEYVHWERRRALEFLRAHPDIDHSSWESVDLST